MIFRLLLVVLRFHAVSCSDDKADVVSLQRLNEGETTALLTLNPEFYCIKAVQIGG